jgi:neuroplastin
LTEGEKLELKCAAWGHPAPTVRWTRVDRGSLDPTSDRRISLGDFDGVHNASLTLADVTLDDYGSYTCIADNGYSYSNSTFNTVTILVRVKGMHYSYSSSA